MDVISREDAQARGIKRYYTGNLCKNGHDAERRVLSGHCVSCTKEAVYRVPREERLRRQKEYDAKAKAKDPEKKKQASIAATKRLRLRNPLYARRAAAKYRAKHPDRAKRSYNEWASHNREKINALHREGYRRNIQKHRSNNRLYLNQRRTTQAGNGGHFAKGDIDSIRRAQKNRCAYCRQKKKLEIDHIIPVFLGGTSFPKNIQLLCRSCNAKKSKRHPLVYARTLGLLI